MSDEEVMKIKAPPMTRTQGRLKGKRFVSFLDKIEKKNRSKTMKSPVGAKKKTSGKQATEKVTEGAKKNMLKGTSTKITPHWKICKTAGHNRSRCPNAKCYYLCS